MAGEPGTRRARCRPIWPNWPREGPHPTNHTRPRRGAVTPRPGPFLETAACVRRTRPRVGKHRISGISRGSASQITIDRRTSMSKVRTALVIGGGIAGPVVAAALCRAGLEATVYEAYPAPSNGVGSALALAPNGLAALSIIDAADA